MFSLCPQLASLMVRWGDSPINPPGAGPQSWLFCFLISLG